MNKNGIRHDLCVAYAQARMMDEISKCHFPEKGMDETDAGIQAAQKMVGWYNQCMDEMRQIKDGKISDPDD